MQLEVQLRENLAKHELLAIYCPDLISLHSPTSRFEFVYASAASRMLLGYEESQLIGLSFLDLVQRDDSIAWHLPSAARCGGLQPALEWVLKARMRRSPATVCVQTRVRPRASSSGLLLSSRQEAAAA